MKLLFAMGLWLMTVSLAAAAGKTDDLPVMRWDHLPKAEIWTEAAIAALEDHGAELTQTVPADIANYCPAYPKADMKARQAFWVGLMSALAKHESTWRPTAVGGDGRWYGLLQIAPGTAQSYGCKARSGDDLKQGPANLSCAVRIWAKTVSRDGVISDGMRGVAADWGPFHSRAKRQDIMEWTRAQDYCQYVPRKKRWFE